MRSSVLLLATILPWLLPAPAPAGQRVYSVLDYGAVPDGRTLSTAAVQKAIDACAAEGGGTVRFPAGTFLTGSLRLKSGVTLLVDQGATLLGSRSGDDYYGPPIDADGRPIEGPPVFHNLIHGGNLHDVAIRGPGTIDGSGAAFRDKTKKRPKAIYLENCRNVLVEDVRLRSAGSWMQHYRLSKNLTIRNVDVFNHVSFNNDGLNVDSCENVTITDCRVDSDDDGIVLKSLSDRPCQNVNVTHCTVSSHCNALKMGTESGGGFVDVAIRDCTVFSPRHSQSIYGRQRGLAGVALEIVDGGRLENVTVSDVRIDGVSVPVFLRLGDRGRPYAGAAPGVGTFRNVRIENITAQNTSLVGCSITGLPGHPVENVTLVNLQLGLEGGGTREDAAKKIPEREDAYPESTMFGTLPAFGFYCRHVRGLKFEGLKLQTSAPDLRHAMVLDDVEDVDVDRLDAPFSPGGAAMLRMIDVRHTTLRGLASSSPVDVLLEVDGKATDRVVLEKSQIDSVRRAIEVSKEVPDGAVRETP